MGRPLGVKQKKQSSEKIGQLPPAPPICLGCGAKASIEQTDLGPRCTACYRLVGILQQVKENFHHGRFKVKELQTGEWDAHGRGAFMVIDYAI